MLYIGSVWAIRPLAVNRVTLSDILLKRTRGFESPWCAVRGGVNHTQVTYGKDVCVLGFVMKFVVDGLGGMEGGFSVKLFFLKSV